MNTILIEGVKLYAYHGCLEEEAIIGGNYVIDIEIKANLDEAIKTDDLNNTVDYMKVYQIVRREMKIRSNLIEHAANRIARALLNELKKAEEVAVNVTKLNPPVNGEAEKVSAIIKIKK